MKPVLSNLIGIAYSIQPTLIIRMLDNKTMYGCFLLIHYNKEVYTEDTAYKDLLLRCPFVQKVSNATHWIRTMDEDAFYVWALEE